MEVKRLLIFFYYFNSFLAGWLKVLYRRKKERMWSFFYTDQNKINEKIFSRSPKEKNEWLHWRPGTRTEIPKWICILKPFRHSCAVSKFCSCLRSKSMWPQKGHVRINSFISCFLPCEGRWATEGNFLQPESRWKFILELLVLEKF